MQNPLTKTNPPPLPTQLRRGVASGAVGGALMSVATNVEMRVRDRAPSRVPAQAIERFLPLELSKYQEERLVTIGHVASSAGLGATLGLLRALIGSRGRAYAGFVIAAFLPDFVLMPAAGSAAPPWRWKRSDVLISTMHHGVYAAGTIVTFAWLRRRDGRG